MRRTLLKLLSVLLSVLLLLSLSLTAFGTQEQTQEITSLDQLATARIGAQTGTTCGMDAEAHFPDAQVDYYNNVSDLLAALRAGKADAAVMDVGSARFLMLENKDIAILDEHLSDVAMAPVFPKTEAGQALCTQYNAFIKTLWDDGTMKEIDEKWFGEDESARTVLDYESLPGENGTLTMSVDATLVPFGYMKENRVIGYDVDVMARFCEANGYRMEVVNQSFDGMLASVQSGKCDFAACNITITEERKEAMLFGEPDFYGGNVAIVLKGDGAAPAAQTDAVPEYTAFSDLKGKTVSMLTGAPFEELVRSKEPDVGEFTFFNNMPDMILALKSGKIDALLNNNAIAQLAVNRNPDLCLFPQSLKDGTFGFAFAKGDPRRDEWQAAFDRIPEETKQAAWEKWTGSDEAAKVLPEQDWPGSNGTMTVAACDTLEPMSYAGEGGVLQGFDIELLLLTAKELDIHLDFTGLEFSSVLASVQAGKADIGTGSVIITDERKEAVDFVEYYPASFELVVRAAGESAAPEKSVPAGVFTSLEELSHATIGVQTGTSFDDLVSQRLPEAKKQYFNSKADLSNALASGKIDAYAVDEPVIKAQMYQNSDLTYVPEYLDDFSFGYVFQKGESGQKLCDQMSEFLLGLKADGSLAAIEEKWLSNDESRKTVPDYQSFPAPNGTLRLATEALYEPFSYIANGEIVGYDIDIAAQFCEAYGYGLEIVDMSFDGILPAVQTGKCDFAAAGITITEERKESVLFSEPNYSGGAVMAVLRAQSTGEEDGFLSGIAESFQKTFLREQRWKLFLSGTLTTLLITACSVLLGTALGFGVFLLCRNGNPVANAVTGVFTWLVQGMPVVVLLMVLYYIVFGSLSISGILVSIIGFTLTFGAAVLGLLRMGVGAVDGGQYEAAYALGYSNTRTFFRIILPQAIPHVLSAYKGEIVGLIKATAIVGYIAVQDLTKVGDIVRSRTYEAFFPLIAVSIIYFLLEILLAALVNHIEIRIDPKKRSRESILKGVDTHD